jgi:hypothetical protein
MGFMNNYSGSYLNTMNHQYPCTVKIRACTVREIQGEKKLCIQFDGIEREWAVNRTSAKILAAHYGDEEAALVGKSIRLELVDCLYMGNPTKGIRCVPADSPGAATKPPANGGASAACLAAMTAYAAGTPGKTKDQIRQLWIEDCYAYFDGRGVDTIRDDEWRAFTAHEFVRPAPDEIPF